MPRKLKTYQTSLGFFDQAVAAPSIKAALEAWGTKTNLFHQGVAKEVDDPDIIAATMRKPGVILKRPIGSNGPFKEHADLPTHLPVDEAKRKPAKRPAKLKQQHPRQIDDKAARKAALAYEREQSRRESERRKEDAALAKNRERREKAVAKAQAAIQHAKRHHDERASTIQAEWAALEERSQAEDARWEKQKGKLEIALRQARDSGNLSFAETRRNEPAGLRLQKQSDWGSFVLQCLVNRTKQPRHAPHSWGLGSSRCSEHLGGPLDLQA
jgi:colicin import membrane protein